ncbi:nuclear transport factor 2 family protein [Winogradskyella ursingii]|uniref:nuclear transport factor 2 family protein n=1 Tax=Winogradskyella ursingii TaxID=2686079 RepID=UPI0015CB6B6B|nr:nuclear transport factor 2 family protein [Winogradskyella ursingii]
MLKKFSIIIFSLALFSHISHSQPLDNLKAINLVWADFYKAFDSLDISYMEKIHSKDLVRIPGGNRILDYETYINNYNLQFTNDKTTNQTNEIELRFFERINTSTKASERGVYKMIRNKNTPQEQIFYGQFHVLLKKIDGKWKIIMDYDSTENGKIDQEEFREAHAIDDFNAFLSN